MVNKEYITEFFDILNKCNIQYVLIKNDDDRIPESVEDGDDVDILIHPTDYNKFADLMNKEGYIKVHNEFKKYYFIYGLKPDLYLKKTKLIFMHTIDWHVLVLLIWGLQRYHLMITYRIIFGKQEYGTIIIVGGLWIIGLYCYIF